MSTSVRMGASPIRGRLGGVSHDADDMCYLSCYLCVISQNWSRPSPALRRTGPDSPKHHSRPLHPRCCGIQAFSWQLRDFLIAFRVFDTRDVDYASERGGLGSRPPSHFILGPRVAPPSAERGALHRKGQFSGIPWVSDRHAPARLGWEPPARVEIWATTPPPTSSELPQRDGPAYRGSVHPPARALREGRGNRGARYPERARRPTLAPTARGARPRLPPAARPRRPWAHAPRPPPPATRRPGSPTGGRRWRRRSRRRSRARS